MKKLFVAIVIGVLGSVLLILHAPWMSMHPGDSRLVTGSYRAPAWATHGSESELDTAELIIELGGLWALIGAGAILMTIADNRE